jgi:hypothetical protein
MFPSFEDRDTYKIHDVSLLQAFDVVTADEITNQKHRDAGGEPVLIGIKHGATTGTSLCRVNGLESVKRTYPEHGIDEQDSLEIAVVYYGEGHGRFSEKGDSGSIVLTRDGKILGMLTGGTGPTDEIDVTYVTPFWWLLQLIKEVYPNAHVYPVKTAA